MWIHQRTGRNTAVSAPMWAYMLGWLMLIGLVVHIWPVAVAAVVLYAVYHLVNWRAHRTHLEQTVDACRLCQREIHQLRMREQRELQVVAERADAERLRVKYRR